MFWNDLKMDLRYRMRKGADKSLPHRMTFGDRFIYDGNDVSMRIAQLLESDRPCLVTRYGWTELNTVLYFLKHCHSYTVRFREKQKHFMKVYSGFLNPTDYNLARFCAESLQILDHTDVLGIGLNRGDDIVLQHHGANAALVNMDDIGNVLLQRQWLPMLKGRKVLVVHPFVDTIRAQYEKRRQLFPDPEMLPDFELKTVKAVQSAGDATGGDFGSWFDALEYMCGEIRKVDYDVALIGAGAYGMFLGDFCKSQGKQAIHVGGALQLLFGVIGDRWTHWDPPIPGSLPEENSKHWVRPSEAEKIAGQHKVEGSCYW